MNTQKLFAILALQPLQENKQISTQVQNISFIARADRGGAQIFRNAPHFVKPFLASFNKTEIKWKLSDN